MLKCNVCGNTKRFYRSISIDAKLRVNSNGEDMKMIYDINKNNVADWFEPIYCCECDSCVVEARPLV
jgi:hypothetical protein